MNRLNLYHLKYFVDAAREGGVSAAARVNFVTQSAVSRAISSLERDLGVALVKHGKNHFQLTEAGETILGESRKIFESVTQLKNSASAHLNTLRGPLRFGCNQAIASRLIAPALAKLEEEYPDIKPEMSVGNTDQIQQLLDKDIVDFGIVVDDGEVEKQFQTRKIFTDNLLVVVSPKFKKKDPLRHLMISRTQSGSLSRKYFRQYEKLYGEPFTPKMVVPSWQVIMDLAIAGYGSALVPGFICEEALRLKKLEIVNKNVQPVSFDLCTIVKRNRVLPNNAQALLEQL